MGEREKLYAALACFVLAAVLLNTTVLPKFKSCILEEHFGGKTLGATGTYLGCSQETFAEARTEFAIATAAMVLLIMLKPAKRLAAAKGTRETFIIMLVVVAALLSSYFAPGRMLLYDGVVFQAASQSYHEMLSEGELPYFYMPWALGSMHAVYHGQLFFMLSGLAGFVFSNIDMAFRALTFLLHLLSAAAAFLLIRYLLKDNKAALLGAAIYALIPEHTLKMLLLGRTITAPVYALLPLGILIAEVAAEGKMRKIAAVAGLALISALMFLSSPQDAQVTVALMMAYFGIRLLNGKITAKSTVNAAAMIAAVGGLFLLLTAYWTVPYILESGHVNNLQQKALGEFAPKLPGVEGAAKTFVAPVALASLAGMGIDFGIDYLGISVVILAVAAAMKVADRRVKTAAWFAAAAFMLGLVVTARTGIFLSMMLAIAGAAGAAAICARMRLRDKAAGALAYGAIFIIVVADLGIWAAATPFPDFTQQQDAYSQIPMGGNGMRALDLHSNRRTYYPALAYMERKVQVPFSVLTVGDPKAFYYAATAASRAAQEVYDMNSSLSDDAKRALYMYNTGYVIIHPDQIGKTAAESFADKSVTLGLEKESPQVIEIEATPIIVAAKTAKIPKISENEKGLFYSKIDFEERRFPWGEFNAAVEKMKIDTATNSAAVILLADDEDNKVAQVSDKGSNPEVAVIEHAVKGSSARMAVEMAGEGYAQLSYAYYPWLEVKVDGQAVPVYKSAFNLAVIELPEGRHTIEIRARTTPLRKATLLISAAALIVVVAVLLRTIFKPGRRGQRA